MLAKYVPTGDFMAIKSIKKTKVISSSKSATRAKSEKEIMANVDHPFVVDLL